MAFVSGGACTPPGRASRERALFACEHPVTGLREAPGAPEACNRVPPMSTTERTESPSPVTGSAQRGPSRLRLAVLDRDPGFMQVLSRSLLDFQIDAAVRLASIAVNPYGRPGP